MRRLFVGMFMAAGLVASAESVIEDLPGKLAMVDALGDLTSAPAMYVDDVSLTPATVHAGEIKAVYFSGLDYKGKPTRVYAYVGIPEKASEHSPVPGMVLVHGGGGTAFNKWVELWKERGYAAVSIAVEGQTDQKVDKHWARHAMSGPVRAGIYNDSNVRPITDQWMYHAVADTVLANSLLRSLPEVDARKIGLTGMSWGGVITSTAIGIDDRFLFAVPVYGCGHLYDSRNLYGSVLGHKDVYRKIWDPMVRMSNVSMPVLWLSWPEDPHFPMDSLAYTYHAMPGPYAVTMKPGMRHGHLFAIPEPYDFADSMVEDGEPWCMQTSLRVEKDDAAVVFKSKKTLQSAVLVYTTGNDEMSKGIDTNLKWLQIDLKAPKKRGNDLWEVSAKLPEDTTAWFVNVKAAGYKDVELTASSDYQEYITFNPDGDSRFTFDHVLTNKTSVGTVMLSYTGPSNVEIQTISVGDESHPGAFTSLTTAPLVLHQPMPEKSGLLIQFDNSVAGLPAGQSAYCRVTVVWEKLNGSTEKVTLPVRVIVRNALAP